ncbi:MAG TPA: glycosyltransferase family 39 protein [Xanthobacteraceae bacterium]|jgi:4-amino-4-deoxy-L-arabinose transferase-like glycosyltransferase
MTVIIDKQGRTAAPARSLKAVVDFAVGSHGRAVAVLLVVALLSFLPGFFSIPPVDRDEARFAQATKQMVESGDYIDIRFQDEVRYKKPVGIYWLQAAVVRTAEALGFRNALTTISIYRVPSLIGAIGAVLLTYWAALALVSRRAAVLAAMMLATCVLLGIERLLAKTDAMLLMTAVAAMGAMARAYLSPRSEHRGKARAWIIPAVFWTALATGVLLKGPLIVMICALAAVALVAVDRSGRWLLALKPIPGLIWFALLVLPWFLAIIGRAGDAFFAESVGQDLLSKLFSSQESHGAPPGYYFVLFWVTFWPGATLAALATPAVWSHRRQPATKFLLAWLVPSWLVFELVVTKLPHYVLPLYPAIAILIAGVIDTRMLSRRPLLVGGTIWWFVVPMAAGIAGIVALAVVGRQFGLLVWPVFGAAAVMGFLAWRLYGDDGAEHSLLRAIAAAILSAIAIFGLIIPSLSQLFPSPALARVLREAGCAQPEAAAVGYQEPSLVFLAGTATRLTDTAGAADFLRGGECRFAFVEARQERSFAQRAEAIGLRYSAGPRIEAINVSTGQPITIAVYRSAGPS